MRRTRATRTLALIGSAALAVTALTGVPANAAASDVQITELLYHAADADLTYGALEFLEVHNAGSEPVDVGGW